MMMSARYLDPTNDIAFKKLFGTEDHKPLLISFLNSILALEGERRIKQVDFLPKDQIPLIKEAKASILDLKCTDERNIQYIIEIQNRKIPNFIKRTQYYVAHCYVSQAPSGMDYAALKPVILLAIANYEAFPDEPRVVNYYQTMNRDSLKNHFNDMSYVFVELPKFNKTADELVSIQDKWIYFFKNWEKSRDIPKTIQEQELIEAYQAMEEFNWNKAELEAYIKANIALTDEYESRKHEFEKGLQEGKQKGLQEGEQKGLQKGLQEGEQKGLQKGLREGEQKGLQKGLREGEQKGQRAIVQNLLKTGLSIDQISNLTGLTQTEIESLLKFDNQ